MAFRQGEAGSKRWLGSQGRNPLQQIERRPGRLNSTLQYECRKPNREVWDRSSPTTCNRQSFTSPFAAYPTGHNNSQSGHPSARKSDHLDPVYPSSPSPSLEWTAAKLPGRPSGRMWIDCRPNRTLQLVHSTHLPWPQVRPSTRREEIPSTKTDSGSKQEPPDQWEARLRTAAELQWSSLPDDQLRQMVPGEEEAQAAWIMGILVLDAPPGFLECTHMSSTRVAYLQYLEDQLEGQIVAALVPPTSDTGASARNGEPSTPRRSTRTSRSIFERSCAGR